MNAPAPILTAITGPSLNPLQIAFDAVEAATAGNENWQVAATVKGLLIGYDWQWAGAQAQITLLETEGLYLAPLTNIETRKDSRTWRIGGKIDKLAKDNGLVLYDHKTTSSDIADPNCSYWRQLVIEGQASHYELLLLMNGIRLDRVVWDVTRKPGIKPRKLSAAERKVVTSLGDWLGYKVSPETQTEMVSSERENAELYMYRVARECLDNPARYFARRSVPRTREELHQYAVELWEIGQEMLGTRNTGRHFRNSGACMLYGSPCEYLGICSGHDTPDSEKWTRAENVHRELEQLEGTGKDLLTNSRIRCYQTCRRKHELKYEIGIERIDAEEREALYFGTVWGLAMDSYWSATCNKEPSNGDNRSESPANGAGNSEGSTRLPIGA